MHAVLGAMGHTYGIELACGGEGCREMSPFSIHGNGLGEATE